VRTRPLLVGAGLAGGGLLAAYCDATQCEPPNRRKLQSTLSIIEPEEPASMQDRGRTAGVFDGGLGFGKKSAIVVVDFVNAYVEPSSKLYCGDPGFGVVSAIEASKPLLGLARMKGVDVIFTKVLYAKHGKDGGVFAQKIPLLRTFTDDNPLTEIVPEMSVNEAAGDTVIVKKYPSAFFGTELASMLTARGVDTIILLGCSTSGCIRATAIDACQHGFRCIVPRECVGDRTREVHESNLFDINAKSGDVVSRQTVMEYLVQFA